MSEENKRETCTSAERGSSAGRESLVFRLKSVIKSYRSGSVPPVDSTNVHKASVEPSLLGRGRRSGREVTLNSLWGLTCLFALRTSVPRPQQSASRTEFLKWCDQTHRAINHELKWIICLNRVDFNMLGCLHLSMLRKTGGVCTGRSIAVIEYWFQTFSLFVKLLYDLTSPSIGHFLFSVPEIIHVSSVVHEGPLFLCLGSLCGYPCDMLSLW